MTRASRYVIAGAATILLLLGCGQAMLQQRADAQGPTVEGPVYEVDPLWPKPLPNHWVIGRGVGVWVDDQDHVWVAHTGNNHLNENERALELKVAGCCQAAPAVLVFDPAGNLVRSWGGPGAGYEWPAGIHGIHVDHKGNVWIGGNDEKDSHILKFTKEGKFLMQVGRMNLKTGSNDPVNFGRPAKIWVDPKTNEAYVADGYRNKRIVVLDADTGKLKRYWGAYGNKPDDADLGKYNPAAAPPKQFRNPVHCVERSNDGLVYVCDRQADRIQVFNADGTFVKEAHFARETLGSGSAWDLAFSRDPQQRYLFLADGMNNVVRVVSRDSLREITNFGDGGRQPGQFYGVHSIATDSKGNIYTAETFEGKRLQKFVNRGVGRVPSGNQGPPWPRS